MEAVMHEVGSTLSLGSSYFEGFDLVIVDREVAELNAEHGTDYGCFLTLQQDGELLQIWGVDSTVPFSYYDAERVA